MAASKGPWKAIWRKFKTEEMADRKLWLRAKQSLETLAVCVFHACVWGCSNEIIDIDIDLLS